MTLDDPAELYAHARVVLERGDPERALALIDQARSAYRDLGRRTEALRTDLGRMHVLDDLGRHSEAAEIGIAMLEALQQLEGSDDLLALEAAALGNVGVAWGFMGDHAGALGAYQRAERVWRSLGMDHETAMEVANQGVELLALARADEALERLTTASAVFEATDDRLWLGKCDGHRAEALSALGRFLEALGEFQRGREILTAHGANTEAWRLGLGTATTLLALGLVDEAVTVLVQIEPRLREAGLHHDLACALWLRGTADTARSHHDPARERLTEAVALFGAVGDVPGQAKALIELSRCVPPADAAGVAERAAAALEDGRWPGLACLAQVRLAQVYADDEPRQRTALDAARALLDGVRLPHLQQAVTLGEGLALLRHGHHERAIDVLGEALAQVERTASVLPDATLRGAYTRSRTSALAGLVHALLERGAPADVAQAARLVDDAHGRTLVGVLIGELGTRQLPDAESARVLVGELGAAYSALFSADRAQQQVLRARIDTLEGRIAVQEALTPGRARPARRGEPDGPAAPPGPAATSIAYHLLGAEVLAFVTSGSTRVVRRVSTRRRLAQLVEDLESHIGAHAVAVTKRHAHQRVLAARHSLAALYVEVFAPIVHLLPDPAGAPLPLVVVPDGALHRVPFHALYDGIAHLLDRWDITQAPSLSAAAHAAARPVRGRRLLAVGVGHDDAPLIEAEARAVAETGGDGTQLLLGEAATFDAVRRAVATADIVHLACHGLFRPENPAFSSLRLADRWMRAVDAADLDLDGRLVVLSACETGRVDDREGVEAVGLARGFLAAGARNVVVSQWLADDRSTADLMTRLHAGLAAGVHPVGALRRAQNAVMASDPHPFHWAPFVVAGAPAPMSKET